MAKIFKASKATSLVGKTLDLTINRLDSSGRGVATYNKKSIFLDGALVGEKVSAKVVEQSSKYLKAKILAIKSESKYRVAPFCGHYSTCGGCDLQHMSYDKQLSFKQEKVSELFARQNINGLPWYEPITATQKHYRRKARIGVQYNKLGEAIIGFRHRGTNVLTPIKSCEILTQALENVFLAIKQVFSELNAVSPSGAVGHIEVIESEADGASQIHLIVRQLINLSSDAKLIWRKAANTYHWHLWFDDGKNIRTLSRETSESILPPESQPELSYTLLDSSKITFSPSDFIQVNHQINTTMVEQAVNWLALEKDDVVLDLFCGLGNFSLPIARHTKRVVGVEGVQMMADKASINADRNGIENCTFYQADLNANWQSAKWVQQDYTKVVLDPARAGAYEACQQIVEKAPNKILYVSCEPTTLAKDASVLVEAGYQLKKIAIMDMFSQTKHVETMVLFERS